MDVLKHIKFDCHSGGREFESRRFRKNAGYKTRHYLFMYYTYIIKSKIKDRLYLGHCRDLEERLKLHNSGNSRSTKAYIPWEIVYVEEYSTKSEAMKREYEFNSRSQSPDWERRLN